MLEILRALNLESPYGLPRARTNREKVSTENVHINFYLALKSIQTPINELGVLETPLHAPMRYHFGVGSPMEESLFFRIKSKGLTANTQAVSIPMEESGFNGTISAALAIYTTKENPLVCICAFWVQGEEDDATTPESSTIS